MREHHAFLATRRTRRVDDCRDILRCAAQRTGVGPAFGESAEECGKPRVARRRNGHSVEPLPHPDLLKGSVGVDEGREGTPSRCGIDEAEPGPRVRKDESYAFRAVMRIKRHRDHAIGHCRKIKCHPICAVRQQDRGAIAGPQPTARHRPSQAGNALPHLSPGLLLPTTIPMLAVSNRFGAALHAFGEKSGKGPSLLAGDYVGPFWRLRSHFSTNARSRPSGLISINTIDLLSGAICGG
jgi:hypothetical protein